MSDYLWDRSGEPDQEIQKLEEILAPLGYQPRPLEIPATVAPERRRRFLPALAIAATIALAALALGLWLTINRDASVQPLEAAKPPAPTKDLKNDSAVVPVVPAPKTTGEIAGTGPKKHSNQTVHYKSNLNLMARHERRKPIEQQPDGQAIAAGADAEVAEATKEQLMVALRLVSTKLNHAQKRAQGGYPGNQIRNHKVG